MTEVVVAGRNPLGSGTIIRVGPWSGFAAREDGDYRFEDTPDGLKVWKWSGKRWRLRKRYPADLTDFQRYDLAMRA